MGSEELLAAIAVDPDADPPRLRFADWLEKNGDAERADFIRLSCQLDPDRDRLDDETVHALRERVEQLQSPYQTAEWEWLNVMDSRLRLGNEVEVRWRRGFVDSLALPVQWLLYYGGDFRTRYPLLRKLVLFRLNGCGKRLARCEWLRGIREVEFPCWYSDADAEAVANAPNFASVERLVLWSGGGLSQALAFVRGTAGPRLREIHLISQDGPESEWVRAVNEAAGRPIATVFDFNEQLLRFPFASYFGDGYGFYVGKLPDGDPLFAYGPEHSPTADGWRFRADGTRREPLRFEFPPEYVLPLQTEPGGNWQSRWDLAERTRAARKAYLAERIGFRPAFIRVEEFDIAAWEMTGPFYDEQDYPIRGWGEPDDPAVSPGAEVRFGIRDSWGVGGRAYERVRSAEYKFICGDAVWVCDRTGEVVFT